MTDMKDGNIRKQVFQSVFRSDSGKLVLEYLTELYEIKSVDTTNPNEIYFQLGKQAAIRAIKNIIKGE